MADLPAPDPAVPPVRVVLVERGGAWRTWRWLLLVVIPAVVGAAAGVALAVAYVTFARGLPELPTLESYRPPIVTEMISSDGQIAGEFFVERRKVVALERIPRVVAQAFIASEDKNFFEHGGVDWLGTLRAAVNTYVLRRKVQGGSTITQQTAKAILVSAEGFQEGTKRNLRRKFRELLLARQLERAFTKRQILWMYLNGVYLGHHSYGVQAAAENYFRKNVEELTLEEAALVAGLPQAPSRYSPFAHPESARDRRRYVLRRMHEDGAIGAEERRRAEAAEVKVHGVDDVFRETAPFYVEQVRRAVVERYGNDRLLLDGLRVEMAMDLEKQRAAQGAMLAGLMEVDHRQGFLGPVTHVEGEDRRALAARLARAWPAGAIPVREYCVGIVARVDEGAGAAEVEVGENRGLLPIAGMRWARRPNPEAYYPDALISRIGAALRVGDVVVVRRVERKELVARESNVAWGKPAAIPEAPLLFALEQLPKLQGALVSIEPWTGMVVAMVGGYDFEASEFNRAFQACRQPGSTFKPVVYSAAIERLQYTPATVLTDAPIVFRDDEGAWKPQNFGETFKGQVTLRTALVKSMNIPTVKIAEALASKFGLGALGEQARRLGITSPVKQELGSALGSSCLAPIELADVYATFDRYGERRPPLLVKRVLDRDGRVLEDHGDWRDPWVPLSSRLASASAEVRRPRERAIEEKAAFITVHLLQEVATVGTGARAAALGKPAAGKTGTTNDSFDTWFVGFTRDLVASVWLGYDQNESPLGRFETGGIAALPIWLDYMSTSLRGRPQPPFPVPEGIVFAAIDPESGQPAPPEKKGVSEPFVEGTEPAAKADLAGRKGEERDFFLQQ